MYKLLSNFFGLIAFGLLKEARGVLDIWRDVVCFREVRENPLTLTHAPSQAGTFGNFMRVVADSDFDRHRLACKKRSPLQADHQRRAGVEVGVEGQLRTALAVNDLLNPSRGTGVDEKMPGKAVVMIVTAEGLAHQAHAPGMVRLAVVSDPFADRLCGLGGS